MRFSDRTSWRLEQSLWAREVEVRRRQGDLLDLTQTNPTRCGFSFLAPPLLQALNRTENLLYDPDPQGHLRARQAVSSYYAQKNQAVSAQRVLLTAGTSEAYSYLLKLLVNSGEAVMVPMPGYPLLDHLVQLSDAELVRYPLTYEPVGGWRVDRGAFERICTPKVRAVVLVHPNNPTGHYTGAQERAWLIEKARQNGWALIADEVFLDYSFRDGESWPSFAGEDGVLTFTLSGISKILGLPQMKLSWTVVSGPEDAAREAIERLQVMADAYLTVSAPTQHALPDWLAQKESVVREIMSRVRVNRQRLAAALEGRRAELLRADGGWCGVVRFMDSRTDEEFSLALLRQGVLIQPGYLFDLPEHHLVLSFLTPTEIFERGVRRLADLV